jgi:hypothetical protein
MQQVGVGNNPRMDIDNDGSATLDDAALLRSYARTDSIDEDQQLWIETMIEDALLALDPVAGISDTDQALFNRYVSAVSADQEYTSFQVKLVYTNDIGVDINIFPHVRDFRAIALT